MVVSLSGVQGEASQSRRCSGGVTARRPTQTASWGWSSVDGIPMVESQGAYHREAFHDVVRPLALSVPWRCHKSSPGAALLG